MRLKTICIKLLLNHYSLNYYFNNKAIYITSILKLLINHYSLKLLL